MELSAERVLFRRGHPFFDMSGESYISLSELQRRIKSAVETALPMPVWVAAEIAEVKVNYSGHCYMELVEKAEPSASARRRGSEAVGAGACGDMAVAVCDDLILLRGRDGQPSGGGDEDSGAGAGLVPRTLRADAADRRSGCLLYARGGGARASADDPAAAGRRRVGHEPRDGDAVAGAAHSRCVERGGGWLPRLLQRTAWGLLCLCRDSVRCRGAGCRGRGFDRGGTVCRGRTGGGVRCRGSDPRRRLGKRFELFQFVPSLLLCGAVPAARHYGYRSRQGYECGRHGGTYGA